MIYYEIFIIFVIVLSGVLAVGLMWYRKGYAQGYSKGLTESQSDFYREGYFDGLYGLDRKNSGKIIPYIPENAKISRQNRRSEGSKLSDAF